MAHSTNTFLAPHCEEEFAGQHLERFETQIELHMLRNHSFAGAPGFGIGTTGARIPFHEGIQHVCAQLIMFNVYKHRSSSRFSVINIHPCSIPRQKICVGASFYDGLKTAGQYLSLFQTKTKLLVLSPPIPSLSSPIISMHILERHQNSWDIFSPLLKDTNCYTKVTQYLCQCRIQ